MIGLLISIIIISYANIVAEDYAHNRNTAGVAIVERLREIKRGEF